MGENFDALPDSLKASLRAAVSDEIASNNYRSGASISRNKPATTWAPKLKRGDDKLIAERCERIAGEKTHDEIREYIEELRANSLPMLR